MSPPSVRQTTISACPENSVPVGVTSSTCVVAIVRSSLLFELACLGHCALGSADVQEGLFRQMVEVTINECLEGLHGLGNRSVDTVEPGEVLRHEQWLGQETLDLAGTQDRGAVFLRQLVHPEDRNDVLQFTVPLEHLLDPAGNRVVPVTYDLWRQDVRRRSEGVDG